MKLQLTPEQFSALEAFIEAKLEDRYYFTKSESLSVKKAREKLKQLLEVPDA